MPYIIACVGEDVDTPVAETETLEAALDKADELFASATPADSEFWFTVTEVGRPGVMYSTLVVERKEV